MAKEISSKDLQYIAGFYKATRGMSKNQRSAALEEAKRLKGEKDRFSIK